METSASSDRGIDLLARLNRIPVWALPKTYLAVIGLGYFFTFYDISDIGFAMPAIDEQFNLLHSTSLFLALAVGLIGYIVGSFAIGALSDRFGRYRMLIFTIILTAIGSFGDAAAPGVMTLIVFRFITGVGVGADLNLVSTYISELAPPARPDHALGFSAGHSRPGRHAVHRIGSGAQPGNRLAPAVRHRRLDCRGRPRASPAIA